VRFEAEVANRDMLKRVVKLLEGFALKVIGFFESLKVRASEAKCDFPTRHDWDAFFRDKVNKMNELLAGERPDTIHLGRLPCIWFQV
jgi:arginine/serine-rich splicing factor 17